MMAVLWSKGRGSRCPWLLGLVLLSTTLWEAACQTLDCQAGTNDFDKLLTCEGCVAGNDTRVDTIWCIHENSNTVLHPWSGCFSHSDGFFNQSGRTLNFVRDLGVTETGDFLILREHVNSFVRPIFNCTIVGETGQLCPTTEFEFFIFAIQDTTAPPRLATPHDTDLTLEIGSREILCFKLTSPDTNGTVYWQAGSGETVPAREIDSRDCIDCRCAEDTLLPTVVEMMESQSQLPPYSAFYTRVFEYADLGCLPDISNRVLSFLLIDAVSPADSGDYSLTIFSAKDVMNRDTLQYSVNTTYATVVPEYHRPAPSETCDKIEIGISDNAYYICDATTSHGALLFWEVLFTKEVGDTKFEPPEESIGALNETILHDLCQERSADRFAVSLGQRESTEEGTGLVVWVQQTALVVCDALTNFSAIYACKVSDSDHRSSCLDLDVTDMESGPQGGTVSTLIVVLAVLFSLFALAAIVGIACMLFKIHSRKEYNLVYQDTPLEATNPFFENLTEFPRDRLELMEVIGEGQFGQVRRAKAEGICPDNSRNVVAVKTLKPNARPSDRDDLYMELDIMEHMEPHPNIVNFLGQCLETGSDPLLILMEFAVYGSLKSYLIECRISGNPVGPQALAQAPPQATPHNLASLASHTGHLCSYHQQQLLQLQGLGDYPNLLHASDSSSQLSLADPVSMAQARQLLRLLRSDYSYRYCSEYYYYHEGQAEGSGQPENGESDPAFSYSRLAPKYLASNYDRLAPLVAGGRCAYRPCLEDPYNYPPLKGEKCEHAAYYNQSHPSPPVESEKCSHTEDQCPCHTPNGKLCDHAEYYNQSEGECECVHSLHSSISLCQEEVEPREKTPPPVRPTYTNVPEQEAVAVPQSPGGASQEESSPLVSPSYTNVPEPDPEGESMVSLPDGYIYSPSSMCAYCSMQLSATVGCQGEEQGVEREEGPRERRAAEAPQDSDSTLAGGGLTYFDILDFGLQIARGMEHLEKMKCIHRDLAARNVLIAEGFLLKIGDFGLARDLTERDYYRKITPGRLPVRWMAMESLQQRVHNYKSDVWSFGVVLWEVLTYGGTPYGRSPAAHSCEGLIKYLQNGHRLPKPPNCTDELYGLMIRCWHSDPNTRPSFTELISVFDNFLSQAHGYLRVNPDAADQAAGEEMDSPEAAAASDAATLTLSTREAESSSTTYVLQNGRAQPYLEPKPSVTTSSNPPLKQTTSLATSGASSSPATTPDSATLLLASPPGPLSGAALPPSSSGSCHRQALVTAETLQQHPDCLETEV